jgi:glycine/D-amino acid oxidase-like deaminating enzyme
MQIQPPVYLAALLRDFRLAGGSIVVREFHDANEIAALNEPIIVNCTGLGAKALFGDEQLRPVKGQLTVLLPQEEVDYNLLDAGLYMMPRHDGVLLGGSWEEDVWDLEPSPEIEESVLNGHEELFGGLQRA